MNHVSHQMIQSGSQTTRNLLSGSEWHWIGRGDNFYSRTLTMIIIYTPSTALSQRESFPIFHLPLWGSYQWRPEWFCSSTSFIFESIKQCYSICIQEEVYSIMIQDESSDKTFLLLFYVLSLNFIWLTITILPHQHRNIHIVIVNLWICTLSSVFCICIKNCKCHLLGEDKFSETLPSSVAYSIV